MATKSMFFRMHGCSSHAANAWMHACTCMHGAQVIPAAEVVGATLEPPNAVRVWHCQATKSSMREAARVAADAARAAAHGPGLADAFAGVGGAPKVMTPASAKMVYTLRKSTK
jgi:hypothetical protein